MRRSTDSNATLGSSIHLRRRALQLTQQDLSDLSDVALRVIHDLEHDKETVQLDTLLKVLSTLGLHLQLAPGAAKTVLIDYAISELERIKT
jgi:y4mF family transcriptional regulator